MMIGISFTSIVAIAVSLTMSAIIPGTTLKPEPAPRRTTPAPPPGIIFFRPDTNSVLDSDARLHVLDPSPNEIIPLQTDGGSQYYIWFSAQHAGFAFGAETRGMAPCAAHSRIDTGKGDGQHVYVIVDGGPGRVMAISDSIKIPVTHYADSGPHTVRAVMCRSWNESHKDLENVQGTRETDLYCVRTFYIGINNGVHEVDSTLPLLTLSAPLETFNNGTYPSDHVPLDFYVMFKQLSQGYVVEATLMDSTGSVLAKDTLDQWVPYCITGLPDPPSQTKMLYTLRMRLLNNGGTPVRNGHRYDLNDITRHFYVRQK